VIFIFKHFGVKMEKLIETWRIFIAFRIYGPYQEELPHDAHSESLLSLVLPSITKCYLVDKSQVQDVVLVASSVS
jgi:hypothetical protein